ncbi:MAG: triple tyrosine motif-containing protein [Bacteroidota bacterium]|nr:triple tyrosine motif-containing protein [Bacteroidota bacterium]
MKKNSLLLLFFISSFTVFPNQPLVRNFTRANYNAGTQNWAIAQGESNTMYFANNSGLLEFDGKKWATFPIKNGTNVRSILYTRKGRIYAATFNEFGYYKDLKNGQLEYHSLMKKLAKNSINSNELYNILQGDKKIYFQAGKSIYQYNGDTITSYAFNNKIDMAAYVHNVLFVASSQQGVFMLNGKLFVRISGSELLVNKRVCSILPFKGNKILFVTSFNGVYLFDGVTIVPYNTGIDEFLKKNQVFCATTNGKQLVFGTVQNGIVVQDIASGKVIYVNTYSGLQNNTVLSVAFDNQQNLWLGLDKGIDYVMLNSPVLNMFGTNNLYGSGYTSFLKNNVLYFGTNQGLYTSTYPLPNSSQPIQLKLMSGMEGQIWSLNEIDNTLFCGDDQGAFMIYPNHIEKIQGLTGTWSFKPLQHHPGLILGCSYQGLFILKKIGQKWKLSHFIRGKFTESSPMFEEDTDGNVWFSHWQKGLFRLHFNAAMDSITRVELYDNKKGFPSNQNNTLFRIGNEIVFSSERGFYRYNKRANRMEPYGKWNKLFNSPPSYIRLHEGKNGDVWCVSGKFVGLAKKRPNNSYQMDSLTYRILQPKIIMGFEQFNFIDNDNLILSTEDGFSWIDTRRQSATENTFKVYLHNVIITSERPSSPIKTGIFGSQNSSNTYTHRQNSIRFEYAAPEYRNEGLVQYSYTLENYDETWSKFSPDNMKEYTHLPKGHYVFKVRARDVLESKEAVCTYSFSILPAWYETQVAIVIYIILFILFLVKLVLFINQRSKKGALDMERLKEKELEEQKKLHEAETTEKKKEIKELKNQQLQYELRHKSQELASSTMNLIRKNEILLEIMDNITKVTDEIKQSPESNTVLSRLNKMERSIKQNIENDNNWKRFEENFDLVYENYLKRLGDMYPELNTSDKKLCAYLKMDLSSKDIAPLLNMSVRSVEMSRYRLRKKMNLDREVNLGEFLQRF